MREIIEQTKKSIVFFGSPELGRVNYFATGFIIASKDCFHLVTAKHVIWDKETEELTDEGIEVFSYTEKIGFKEAVRPLKDFKNKKKLNGYFIKIMMWISPFCLLGYLKERISWQ